MQFYTIIEECGFVRLFEVADESEFLDKLYAEIGCDCVEVVSTSITVECESLKLIVDESGRLKCRQYNPFASALAGQIIVGPAVLAIQDAEDLRSTTVPEHRSAICLLMVLMAYIRGEGSERALRQASEACLKCFEGGEFNEAE